MPTAHGKGAESKEFNLVFSKGAPGWHDCLHLPTTFIGLRFEEGGQAKKTGWLSVLYFLIEQILTQAQGGEGGEL